MGGQEVPQSEEDQTAAVAMIWSGLVLVPIQLDGSEFVERTSGAPRLPVAPREVPTDALPSDEMGGIIRAVQGKAAHRAEVGLDQI